MLTNCIELVWRPGPRDADIRLGRARLGRGLPKFAIRKEFNQFKRGSRILRDMSIKIQLGKACELSQIEGGVMGIYIVWVVDLATSTKGPTLPFTNSFHAMFNSIFRILLFSKR